MYYNYLIYFHCDLLCYQGFSLNLNPLRHHEGAYNIARLNPEPGLASLGVPPLYVSNSPNPDHWPYVYQVH